MTETVLATPPDDPAVLSEPVPRAYIFNADGLIWVGAYRVGPEPYPLHAGEDGNKVGWFRPAGKPMNVTGRRLDEEAPEMVAEFPCCYPTRFQASGLSFPSAGCWEITAPAGESELTFMVQVEP